MRDMIADLGDEAFPDTVIVTAITTNAWGEEVIGTVMSLKAHVRGKVQRVLAAGVLTDSTMEAIFAGAFGLTKEHQYELPERFNPRKPKAIAVAQRTAENGAHHETVFF